MGDGRIMPGQWSWAAASCRGTAHEKDGSRKQDAFSAFSVPGPEGIFVAVVCDGAGSATFGGEGASLACRTFVLAIRNHFGRTKEFPTESELLQWLDAARDLLGVAAANRSVSFREFSTTLIVVIANGSRLLTLQVGDGGVVAQDADTGEWFAASWPQQGEYASTTYFITSEELPTAKLSVAERPISAVFAFSDGLERLALNFADEVPHAPFFDQMSKPFRTSKIPGKNRPMSDALDSFLGSDQVCRRTEDDKTLVIAVR
jgi:hypothetical protein